MTNQELKLELARLAMDMALRVDKAGSMRANEWPWRRATGLDKTRRIRLPASTSSTRTSARYFPTIPRNVDAAKLGPPPAPGGDEVERLRDVGVVGWGPRVGGEELVDGVRQGEHVIWDAVVRRRRRGSGARQ